MPLSLKCPSNSYLLISYDWCWPHDVLKNSFFVAVLLPFAFFSISIIISITKENKFNCVLFPSNVLITIDIKIKENWFRLQFALFESTFGCHVKVVKNHLQTLWRDHLKMVWIALLTTNLVGDIKEGKIGVI